MRGTRPLLSETKLEVRQLLDELPDDCTLEEVLYRVFVLQQVEAGRRDFAEGRTLSQAEAAMELRRR